MSGAKDHDAVGEEVGLVEIVGSEHDRAALRGEPPHRQPEVPAGFDIHGRGRFVEDQQFGVGHHGHGEPCPLQLAAGELADPPGGEVADARSVERLVDRERRTMGARDEGDGLGNREVGQQGAALQHCADPPVDDRRARVAAEEMGRAGGGMREAEGEIDRGGLARAVGPEQCHDLTAVDVKVDIDDGVNRAEVL